MSEYSGKLNDGRAFTATVTSSSVVVLVAGEQVWPVVAPPPPPPPANPVAGYTKVAREGQTYDLGNKIADVAYGSGTKFAFKSGVKGVVAFNNATFGDPIVNTVKDGYVKVTGEVPTTPPPPPPPPPTKRKNGGISDASTPAVHVPFWKEIGLNSIRIWVGLWDTGDVDENKLRTINSYFGIDGGAVTPRIVLTPPYQGTKIPPHPALAIEKIKRTLDKRVQINLINEPNWSNYWPGNNWMQAFEWAHKVAGELRAAGFKVGTPSFTGWEDSWEGWFDQIIAKGWHTNYDVVVGHNYPNVNPDKDFNGFVSRFDKTNANARRIADKLEKLLGRPIGVDIDEWGLGKNISDDTFLKIMPTLQASLNKYTTDSAYFIVSRSGSAAAPKDPHDLFNWAIDFKSGERRQKVVDGFKAAAKV